MKRVKQLSGETRGGETHFAILRVGDSLYSVVPQVHARSLGANLGAAEAAEMFVIYCCHHLLLSSFTAVIIYAVILSEAKDLCISPQTSVHLRLNSDGDVFEWFKRQGEGHLTRMNAVLRSYVDAHKH